MKCLECGSTNLCKIEPGHPCHLASSGADQFRCIDCGRVHGMFKGSLFLLMGPRDTNLDLRPKVDKEKMVTEVAKVVEDFIGYHPEDVAAAIVDRVTLPLDQTRAREVVKNELPGYMNSLGFTKEYLEKMCDQLFQEYFRGDSFRSYLRTLVITEIKKAGGKDDIHEYLDGLIKAEVRKHVLGRFRVDVKLTLVEPPDGVDRNIVRPDHDPVGEPREV